MNQKINFLLHIRLNQLRREGLDSLSYKQLKRVIYETKWLLAVPNSISQIAADIESLTAKEVAGYLTVNDADIQKSIDELASAFESEDFNIE